MNKSVSISMFQLLSNPEKYNNKNVTIIGYFSIGQGDDCSIFFDEISAKRKLFSNSVSIDKKLNKNINIYKLNNKYCLVEGLFSLNSSGPWGVTSGSFSKIVRIFPDSVSENP